ncbi:Chloroperoxidase [Mycena alexandri]|uniref:Chloroperoxidase n=1 Tax=Mycena alexandri TaxID=1745969 RepID=A0AAD6SGA8_9AGAR|nr:Chloroperoxidase [Mycena alexandri]
MCQVFLAFVCIIGILAASSPVQHARGIRNFNTNQLIQVTGAHKFVSATAADLRGPCPGLNALANHNYISHDGVVSVLDAILVSLDVFGFGPDTGVVAGILSLYGANLPLLDFSIGNSPGGLRGILGIIFGKGGGLSGTHNQFESDSSATRCDLYEPGCPDNYTPLGDRFGALINLLEQNPDPKANFDVIIQHRVNTFHHSVQNNPFFFYGPVQMLVSCIIHTLIPALMSNHSAEYPKGYLDVDGLSSLYGMNRGRDGQFRYTRNERIPENWFGRPRDDPYVGLTYGLPDLLQMWTKYPETFIIGGNTGEVNSFTPLDITDFTHGVYSAESLLLGNNAACFAFQLVQILTPSILVNLEAILAGLLADVAAVVGEQILALACPTLEAMKLESLNQYPGYKKSAGYGM